MNRIKKPTPFLFVKEFINLPFRKKLIFIFGHPIEMINENEFIDLLIEGYSLFRWADGETALARGKSISYQEANPDLSAKLISLVSNEGGKIIAGISWVYRVSLFSRLWDTRLLKILLSTKLILTKYFSNINRNRKIVETLIWYDLYEDLPKILSRICEDKFAILITAEKRYLEICPNNTKIILAPKKDAFSSYTEICESLNILIKSEIGNFVVISTIGPTSKALVADFHEVCQIIDVGHGFSFYFGGYGNFAWREKVN